MKNTKVLLNVFFRSFFIQALWNFERMQNIGFAFCILPILRSLYPDKDERKEALKRHMNFFNTHPYMVSMIIGMVASLEQDIAEKKAMLPEHINILKNNMAGPLAAIGDTFFWATWRPFSVLIALSAALFLFKFGTPASGFIVPLLFIVFYNSVPLIFRYWSLRVSYSMHARIVDIVASLAFQKTIDTVKTTSIIVLIAAIAFYFYAYADNLFYIVVFAGAFMLSLICGCLRISSTLLFFSAIASCVIIVHLKG